MREAKKLWQREHAMLVAKKKMYMEGKYAPMDTLYVKTAHAAQRNAHYVGSL